MFRDTGVWMQIGKDNMNRWFFENELNTTVTLEMFTDIDMAILKDFNTYKYEVTIFDIVLGTMSSNKFDIFLL